jgi:hypothetical protein
MPCLILVFCLGACSTSTTLNYAPHLNPKRLLQILICVDVDCSVSLECDISLPMLGMTLTAVISQDSLSITIFSTMAFINLLNHLLSANLSQNKISAVGRDQYETHNHYYTISSSSPVSLLPKSCLLYQSNHL